MEISMYATRNVQLKQNIAEESGLRACTGGGPEVGNGLPQETAFCRKRPAVGNSLYQETAETILRHLFRKK